MHLHCYLLFFFAYVFIYFFLSTCHPALIYLLTFFLRMESMGLQGYPVSLGGGCVAIRFLLSLSYGVSLQESPSPSTSWSASADHGQRVHWAFWIEAPECALPLSGALFPRGQGGVLLL